MSIDEILLIFEKITNYRPKRSGCGYSAKCPCAHHKDKNPSLSIGTGSDGRVLFFCHAGCSFEQICDALGVKPFQLFEDDIKEGFSTATFVYFDEGGNPLYRKVKTGSNSYYFERYERGKWIKGLNGTRRVLYNLPEVISAITDGRLVIIVEGEKDVETLKKYGYVATTNDTGGGNDKWNKKHSESLKGAYVALFYDYDNTGVEHRDNIKNQLKGFVSSLKIVEIPGYKVVSKSGKDVSDWMCEGNSAQNLREIIENAQIVNDEKSESKVDQEVCIIRAVLLKELLDMKIKPPECFLEPFITSSSLGMVYALRGVGKTLFALSIALSIAFGSSFLKFNAPRSRKVTYLDGEMSLHAMKNRIERLMPSLTNLPPNDNFQLVNPFFQEVALPDLATERGQKMLEPLIKDSDVIIVDNLSSWIMSGVENEGESWMPVQEWALRQRRLGKAVIFIHHANKNNNQRGTSRREDVLDYVIKLNKIKDSKPEDGASFEIVFEKNRSLHGDDVQNIQAQLVDLPSGGLKWNWKSTENVELMVKIKELHARGMSQRNIAEFVGVSASTVNRYLNQ